MLSQVTTYNILDRYTSFLVENTWIFLNSGVLQCLASTILAYFV